MDYEKDCYHFVHDKIRESLLQSIPATQLKTIYGGREAFERIGSKSIDQIVRRATYYRLSDWEDISERAYRANLDAGMALLKDYAYSLAKDFLIATTETLKVCSEKPPQTYELFLSLGMAYTIWGSSKMHSLLLKKRGRARHPILNVQPCNCMRDEPFQAEA